MVTDYPEQEIILKYLNGNLLLQALMRNEDTKTENVTDDIKEDSTIGKKTSKTHTTHFSQKQLLQENSASKEKIFCS